MLLRFGVENFRSFRDRAELSMVATRFKDAPDHRFTAPGVDHGVLPVLAAYGANASGKSNLFDALDTMVDLVTDSFVDLKPHEALPFDPFALGPNPGVTKFDVDFVIEGVRYAYGFSYNAERVLDEWLWAYPSNYQQVLFSRSEEEGFYFGPNLKGRKQFLADVTRPNSLVLSAAAQNNQAQLMPIYRWFADAMVFTALLGQGFPTFDEASPLLDPSRAERVREMLRAVDLDVVDFRTRKMPAVDLDAMEGVPAEIRKQLAQHMAARRTIELGHRAADGETVFLKPGQESHGTQMMLLHFDVLLRALDRGSLLVVDELDASLHSALSAQLIALFTSPRANPNGAQLILTTHDQALMKHVRRDSIILVEKARGGASSVVELSEFKTRERDNIARAYAQGRFGGVPILGSLPTAVYRGFVPGEE